VSGVRGVFALASGLSAPVTDPRQLAHQNHWGSVLSASPSTHASRDPLCARASPTRAASGRYLWLLVRQATIGPGEMQYTSARPKHNRRDPDKTASGHTPSAIEG